MAADALLDAVMLLAQSAEPPRAIDTLARHDGRWHCAMRAGLSRRSHKAEHADLSAAVLMALLKTFPRSSRRRASRTSTLQTIGSSLHDH